MRVKLIGEGQLTSPVVASGSISIQAPCELSIMNSAQNEQRASDPLFPTFWVVGMLRLLSAAALSFAAFLAWSAFQAGDIAGCAGGGIWDCSHVLHSKWAKWMSIPVSIPAAALYSSMLISLLFAGQRTPLNVRRVAWSIVTTLAFAAAFSAVWFICLQVFILEHLCKYCLVVHGCGLAIALLTLVHRPFHWAATGKMGALAAAAAGVLILGQVYGKEAQSYAIDVHEAQPSDSIASFDSPTDGEFLAPPDDVFAAPDEEMVFDSPADEVDVFAAPTEDETRPVSTSHPENVPADGNESSQLFPATNGNAVDPFTTVPRRPRSAPVPTLSPPPATQSSNPLRAPKHNSTPEPAGLTVQDDAVRPAGHQPPAAGKRLIRYPGADVNLNVAHWPILGSDQAPHVVVELFDYTCPYCRTMHKHINVARQRFGNDIAFIVMPVPLNGRCNPTITNTSPEHAEACEIARLALGVWRCNADAFPSFHNWLMSEDRSRTAGEARQHAETLVDATMLKEALAKPMLTKFIDRHVALYTRSGKGTLPKLLTERVTVRGKMDSAETFCNMLEEKLKIGK